jgi:hypothetical protein
MTKDNASRACAIAAESGVTPKQTCAAGSVPEGWKLLQREATDAMCAYAKHRHPEISREQARGIWWSMWEEASASPSPPVIESGWRDISTAPKDGRDVLCWSDGLFIGAMVLYDEGGK